MVENVREVDSEARGFDSSFESLFGDQKGKVNLELMQLLLNIPQR